MLTSTLLVPGAGAGATAPAPARVVPTPDPEWSPVDDLVLRVPRAWQVTAGGGVTVAVVDSGVDATHPELAGALAPGVDLVGRDAVPDDTTGFGTAVAGVIAARLDGAGTTGVAYEATVLPVKVTDAGPDAPASSEVVAEGVRAAAARGAAVIHVSHSVPEASTALRSAVAAAIASGAVVVAPAGDARDGSPCYPAAWATELPGLVAVSRSDEDETRSGFQSWGDWVTVAAPGDDVPVPTAGAAVSTMSADALASARVAGVVALVRAHEPGLTPAQVDARLALTARDAGTPGADPYYGDGVVDAAAAVTLDDPVPAAVAPALDRSAVDGGQDDVMAGARRIDRTSGDSPQMRGTFDTEGDVDWYVVDAAPGERFVARGTGVIDVYAADGAHLATTGWSPMPLWSQVEGPGPLYLRVRADFPRVLGGYEVELRRLDEQPVTALRFDREPVASRGGFAWGGLGVADVTGDGVDDVVAGTIAWERLPQGGSRGMPAVGYMPGRGDGTFGTFATVTVGAVSGGTPSLTSADLDGDGVTEVVVATGTELWTVDLSGTDPAARRLAQRDDWSPRSLVAVDLDDDGDQDLAGVDSVGALVVLNDGSGGMTPTSVPAAGLTITPAAADVDRDGMLDLVYGGPASTVLYRQRDGSFVVGPAIDWLMGSSAVQAGDLTGDGRDDVVASLVDGRVVVSRWTPTGWSGPQTVTTLAPESHRLALVDMDADGRTDVVSSPAFVTAVSLQQPDGTFLTDTFRIALPDEPLGGPAVPADLDGDGLPELALTDRSGAVQVAHQGRQLRGMTPWVTGVSPAPTSAGAAVRPTVAVTLGRDVERASVTAQTVRLVDAATRAPVAVQRTVSADGVVRMVPTADLVPGRTYTVRTEGLRAHDGTVQTEATRSWFTVAAGGDRFTPLEPVRVFDSRDEVGRIDPDQPIQLWFGGVLPQDATAVVLNVTAVAADAVGNVRVYPTTDGGVPPEVSNINVVPGVDQPAAVTVGLGVDLSVDVLTEGASADLVVDLAGYFSPSAATAFTATSPVRLMDTRDGTGGVPALPVTAGRWVELQVAGRGGVPVDASAVALNVTATEVAARTHVRVYPTPAAYADQAPPMVSNLNLMPGRDQANMVVVRVGDGGRIRLYTHSAAAHLVVDLAGWYTATGELGFVPVEPARIVDSRRGQGLAGALRSGRSAEVAVGGLAGVPGTARAAVLTVTGTGHRAGTHIRTFPVTDPATLPLVSTLNLVARRDEANATVARLGRGGRVGVYSASADIDLVVDVSGYFTR
ncbi:FG-GAP-like repeat-containing protein [uncultured Cellulomonas sp.]|uniref:FG-GAP-like repeat-containing protein n=1 Tax=uncultured Cellulomonas sp. TaxID=189682 RepID=UPI00262D64E0|nr:S8 family serine peptidase [uncultured Cellulomonas sp.]